MVILPVALEMFGQIVDPLGQKSDLHRCGTGIGSMCLEIGDDFLLIVPECRRLADDHRPTLPRRPRAVKQKARRVVVKFDTPFALSLSKGGRTPISLAELNSYLFSHGRRRGRVGAREPRERGISAPAGEISGKPLRFSGHTETF